MPGSRKQLGDFGESYALGYLLRQGLQCVATKWRCATGEIDLIMRDGATLVFVEVRTRRDNAALESVGPRKQAKLVALAYSYLETLAPNDPAWRIDTVGVQVGGDGRVLGLEWLCNAVEER